MGFSSTIRVDRTNGVFTVDSELPKNQPQPLKPRAPTDTIIQQMCSRYLRKAFLMPLLIIRYALRNVRYN